VWDMCGVRYVWDMCGVRYANNLLKNPATKRLSGEKMLELWYSINECVVLDIQPRRKFKSFRLSKMIWWIRIVFSSSHAISSCKDIEKKWPWSCNKLHLHEFVIVTADLPKCQIQKVIQPNFMRSFIKIIGPWRLPSYLVGPTLYSRSFKSDWKLRIHQVIANPKHSIL